MVFKKIFSFSFLFLISSCLSFNNPNSEKTSSNDSSMTLEKSLDINQKVEKAMANLNGKSFSLSNLKKFKITNPSDSDKFRNTILVILGEGKNILISGPAPIINNKNFKLDKEYTFFQVKEKYNSNIISSIIKNSSSDHLSYRLSL